MKNKGYTLLELLGVMVILALLVTLAFPTIINFIKKSNDKTEQINNDLIISAASKYMNDNSSNLYLTSGGKHCVSIDTLIDGNYLKIIEEDNYINKSVKVTYNKKLEYEIVDKEECAIICNLVDGNKNTIGAKYQCKVKEDMEEGFEDGYYFHILSYNNDETTNLIMDRNICEDGTVTSKEKSDKCFVAYNLNSSGFVGEGPITAMTYLNNATNSWNNIPNLNLIYNDEGGNFSNFKITGKARMARYDEVHGQGKCSSGDEDDGSEYRGSCPLYLSNYLSNSEYVTGEGLQNIEQIEGYWILSSSADDMPNHIESDGYIGKGCIDAALNEWEYGVRPVITIPNEYLQ